MIVRLGIARVYVGRREYCVIIPRDFKRRVSIAMTAIAFTQADSNNLELVRQIVLRRLKDGEWNQLYDAWDEHYAGKYITFPQPWLRNQFIVLVLEVMWQLIIQG